jgi:hypothetical protein
MNLIALALASTLTCQPVINKELVGLWESTSISKGGIGNNIEFRMDGSYIAAVTVLVDLRYEVKNGKLYTGKNAGEPVSYEAGTEIKVENNALVLIGQNGEKEVRKRISPGRADSVVGKYKYRHYTGAIAYEQYTADGVMQFRLPMRSTRGCYLVTGNEVKVIPPDQEAKTLQYKLSTGQLILIDQKNPSTYKRVKDGAWYESGNIDYKPPDK